MRLDGNNSRRAAARLVAAVVVSAALWLGPHERLIGAARAAYAGQASPVSVWSGVYTVAQADRGKALYAKECASCHAENLQGGDEAPGLSGQGFLAPWTDLSVGDLVERIRVTMPQDRPGQLSRAACADIVAHLLRANDFPAGERELGSDAAVLKQIAIVPKPAH